MVLPTTDQSDCDVRYRAHLALKPVTITLAPMPDRNAVALPPPARRDRVAIAALVAVSLGWITYITFRSLEPGPNALRMPSDWLWHYRAARALLDGNEPYAVVRAVGQYPWNANYVYPLPAAIIMVPFALLPVPFGPAVVAAGCAGLLAYAVTERGWYPLWLFASNSYIWVVYTGQLTPLFVAAALLPVLSGLLVVKPTLELALATYRPSWWLVGGAVALCAAALVVDPRWVQHWLDAVRTSPWQAQYRPPILVLPLGPMLGLALLRWRRPEARLLAALACIPTNYFWYDQLALFLVPFRWWQAAGLAVLTHLVTLFVPKPAGLRPDAITGIFGPPMVALVYLPCLAMVLARPNEGVLPCVLERLSGRLPAWLRGADTDPLDRASVRSTDDSGRAPPHAGAEDGRGDHW